MKIVPGKLEALPETAWDPTMNIGLKGAFLDQTRLHHAVGPGPVAEKETSDRSDVDDDAIRANAITPGYIRTPGTEAMYANPEIYEGRRKGVPMGCVGSREDIAGPAVFLACDESRYTTGSVVGSDGGQAVGYFLTVPGRRFSSGPID